MAIKSRRRSQLSKMIMQSTMRAAVRDDYGDAEVIRVAQIPVPAIADDEVLIRVGAAGVDRGTWHLLTGTPYLDAPHECSSAPSRTREQ